MVTVNVIGLVLMKIIKKSKKKKKVVINKNYEIFQDIHKICIGFLYNITDGPTQNVWRIDAHYSEESLQKIY